MTTKKSFRQAQIARLQQVAPTKIELNNIYQQLFASKFFSQAQTIGITLSRGFELPTQPIIDYATAQDKQIFVPKTLPNRQMTFAELVPAELNLSNYGLLEPQISETTHINNQPDLLIVPGIAFSQVGHYRVGFGGGYYDRFLAQHQLVTCSLATTAMLFERPEWPVEVTDIPITNLIFATKK